MPSIGFDYDVAVVGGGPAGLTSALYTTRTGLDTIVIDRGGGRAAMMTDTHNVIGVTEDVSGNEFLETAREQIQSYGATYQRGLVDEIESLGSVEDGFRVTSGDDAYRVQRVVLATGFADERPEPPLPRTGRGLHWCLHCDAFMFVDEPVFVMGTGDSAAYVSMIMLNFTDSVSLLTRGDDPEWSDETDELLANHPVEIVTEDVTAINKSDDGWLESFEFEDGTVREFRGGFPMYGSDYHADLADGLGLDRNDDGTVAVDDAGRTSVAGVYAVGDLTPGHNQIPIAMGEGADTGLAIHKELREFPRSIEDVRAEGPVDEDAVPAISEELLAVGVAHEGHAGGPREREHAESKAADD